MTVRVPFTQARIGKAIAAAKKAGLRVVGIKPDGTVLVQEGDTPIVPADTQEQAAPAGTSWDDV